MYLDDGTPAARVCATTDKRSDRERREEWTQRQFVARLRKLIEECDENIPNGNQLVPRDKILNFIDKNPKGLGRFLRMFQELGLDHRDDVVVRNTSRRDTLHLREQAIQLVLNIWNRPDDLFTDDGEDEGSDEEDPDSPDKGGPSPKQDPTTPAASRATGRPVKWSEILRAYEKPDPDPEEVVDISPPPEIAEKAGKRLDRRATVSGTRLTKKQRNALVQLLSLLVVGGHDFVRQVVVKSGAKFNSSALARQLGITNKTVETVIEQLKATHSRDSDRDENCDENEMAAKHRSRITKTIRKVRKALVGATSLEERGSE